MSRSGAAKRTRADLEHDPFWQALMRAPEIDGAPTEEEVRAVREAEESRRWVDGATVSAEIASRARRG